MTRYRDPATNDVIRSDLYESRVDAVTAYEYDQKMAVDRARMARVVREMRERDTGAVTRSADGLRFAFEVRRVHLDGLAVTPELVERYQISQDHLKTITVLDTARIANDIAAGGKLAWANKEVGHGN